MSAPPIIESVPIDEVLQLPTTSPSTTALLTHKNSFGTPFSSPFSSAYSPLEFSSRYSINSFERQSEPVGDSVRLKDLKGRTSFRQSIQHGCTIPEQASTRHVTFADAISDSDNASPFKNYSTVVERSENEGGDSVIAERPNAPPITDSVLYQNGLQLTIPKPVVADFCHKESQKLDDQSNTTIQPLCFSPSGLNRWIVLIICLFITVSTGSFFFNWPTAQNMILSSGAYSWLCEAEYKPSFIVSNYPIGSDSFPGSIGGPLKFSGDFPLSRRLESGLDNYNKNLYNPKGVDTQSYRGIRTTEHLNEDKRPRVHSKRCNRQIQSINALMPIGVASWFFFSFVGGVAMDTFGPRVTSISGLILSSSGWVVLGCCSESFPLYMFAFGLIGCGVDVVFIGILNTSNLFPNYRGTVVSVFNAARSLAYGIPTVINFMITSSLTSLQRACFSYALFLGLLGIVVYLVVPRRAHPNLHSFTPTPKNESNEEVIHQCGRKSEMSPSNTLTGLESMVTISSSNGCSTEYSKCQCVGDICPSCSRGTEIVTEILEETQYARAMKRIHKTIELMKLPIFYPLIPLATLTILRGSFLSNSAIDQLGPFVNLFTVFTPLSFVAAPLFGLLADKVSIHFVFSILNSLGFLQFAILVLFPTSTVSLVAVTVLNLFISSFFLGQFYCYVTLSFPSEFTGTLVGITISCSGLFGLLVTPMYNYSTTHTHNFTVMNTLCLAFAFCSYLFIFILWRSSKTSSLKNETHPNVPKPCSDLPRSLSNLSDYESTPLHYSRSSTIKECQEHPNPSH